MRLRTMRLAYVHVPGLSWWLEGVIGRAVTDPALRRCLGPVIASARREIG